MNIETIARSHLVIMVIIALTTVGYARDPQPVGITRVAWLQGCWERVSPAGTIEEYWMTPRGGCMIGMSRTVRGDSLSGYEVVVLREEGNLLAYKAHPSGQPAAVFLSRTVSDTMVVFENEQHDFPQRIGYQRDGPDKLTAWIEGMLNGQMRRINFLYRRAVCPGTE